MVPFPLRSVRTLAAGQRSSGAAEARAESTSVGREQQLEADERGGGEEQKAKPGMDPNGDQQPAQHREAEAGLGTCANGGFIAALERRDVQMFAVRLNVNANTVALTQARGRARTLDADELAADLEVDEMGLANQAGDAAFDDHGDGFCGKRWPGDIAVNRNQAENHWRRG
jgi:hypothetical protein